MSASSAAKRLLAEATGAEAAFVPDDARIGSFERWDSLAHMRLVLSLEQRIGRELDPDEVVEIESLDDLRAILEANQPGRANAPAAAGGRESSSR
jgi:acyl carrier protein